MVRREAELGGALGLEAPVDQDLPVQRHYAVEAPETAAHPNTYLTLPYKSNNRNEDH